MDAEIMDAETIAQKARKSISRFCSEECHAYCCRKGYLVLALPEIDLVTQHTQDELEKGLFLRKINEKQFSLHLCADHPCPSLKDCRCLIHRQRKRPSACKQFPIFIKNNQVSLSHRCLAVQSGLFYPFLKKMLALGYTVRESDPFYDSEFYQASFSA